VWADRRRSQLGSVSHLERYMGLSTNPAAYLKMHLKFIEEAHVEKWKFDHDALAPVWMMDDLVSQVVSLFDLIGKADTDARLHFARQPEAWDQSVLDQFQSILAGWLKNAKKLSALVDIVERESGAKVDKAETLRGQIEDAEWALADSRILFNVDVFKEMEDEAVGGMRE
jgi:hypothetical protein